MQGLDFPEHEYLTVRELAELLRLKERKVYDLAASGEVPCSRATGKLLFPADEIRAWIGRAKSGGPADQAVRLPIILGSHDPLLDWAIRQSGCGLATYFDGSLDGIERFVRREGIAAGLHVHDATHDTWNTDAVSQSAADQDAVLVAFASRQRGLVSRSGGPSPKTISELEGLRLSPRQPGSGTHGLFLELTAAAGVDTSRITQTPVARTEDAAVESVRRGEADVTFGLETVARSFGLEFVPLVEEEYSILVDRKAWFDKPMQTLLDFCGTSAFRDRAQNSGGYDVSKFGEVLWNA